MRLRIYEVDVLIHDTNHPDRRGVHVFTGVADSPAAALRRAHEVYDAALAAHTAGLEIPGKQPDSWGARGLRPGWQMEWPAARAGLWHNPRQLDHPQRLRAVVPPRGSRCAWRLDGCPGPIHPARDETENPSMSPLLRVQGRIGQRTLLLTTAAVPLTSWAVHAVTLHRQLAATRRDPLTGLLRRDSHTARAPAGSWPATTTWP